MSIIVTDSGFGTDNWTGEIVEVANEAEVEGAVGRLPTLRDTLIRIPFGSFADGRGFTLARRLRLAGFEGRLRAKGHVIADQYAMARRAGFDEVEIDEALAARQPETDWQSRADWRAHSYQARLRG
ncbi:MAG: DUF934 domain-containing protein [Pseudooceanicola sp.]|nr:DUF934 domain-containing protein [Pseudooceanicola sp.]